METEIYWCRVFQANVKGWDIILEWKAFRGICVKGVNLIHNLAAHSHFCDQNRLCMCWEGKERRLFRKLPLWSGFKMKEPGSHSNSSTEGCWWVCVCPGSRAGELSDTLVVWTENREWSGCKELRFEKLTEWDGWRGAEHMDPPECSWTVLTLDVRKEVGVVPSQFWGEFCLWYTCKHCQCEGPGVETGTESSEADREVFQEGVVIVGVLSLATFEARGWRLWTLGTSNWWP